MFGKEAPLFVEKVIQAAQSGTAMDLLVEEIFLKMDLIGLY